MNRTGLVIALGIATAVGLLFGLYPGLDLDLAALWFDPSQGTFVWQSANPPTLVFRDISRALITLIVAPAFLALALKLIRPRRPMIIPGRAALLMIVTLALGPGLVTNIGLKNNWGRPRPIDVVQFGGDLKFVPWWDPRGACPTNCSFVAGEPSGGFWTMAPAMLLPAPWRVPATAAALGFGAILGAVRMYGGGHFFTDVVFAGVFMYLLIWTVHGWLYRWPWTRISDAAVERALERMVRPGYDALGRLVARLRAARSGQAP